MNQQSVAAGFQTVFRFRIDRDGADGSAFVVQTAASDAVGAHGGGCGYALMPNSVAVEFDTWDNAVDGAVDPDASHVAFQCGSWSLRSPEAAPEAGATALLLPSLPVLTLAARRRRQ